MREGLRLRERQVKLGDRVGRSFHDRGRRALNIDSDHPADLVSDARDQEELVLEQVGLLALGPPDREVARAAPLEVRGRGLVLGDKGDRVDRARSYPAGMIHQLAEDAAEGILKIDERLRAW